MKIMIVTKTKTHYVTAGSEIELQAKIDSIEKTETIITVLNY